MAVYVDTSALAKWYLPEPRADEFAAWILESTSPTISTLTIVEMLCLLARLRRTGILDEPQEVGAHDLFVRDVDLRRLAVEPVADADFRLAVHLMASTSSHPLRALDAIHLAICTSREIGQLATADAVMAAAAGELGVEVVRFD